MQTRHLSILVSLLFAAVVVVTAQKTPECDNYVNCLVNPCSTSDNLCINPDNCEATYCGACGTRCLCESDSDCSITEKCTEGVCEFFQPIAQEGDSCGGMMIPSAQCDTGLICAPVAKFILDSPGVCRKECSNNDDCGEGEYCSSWSMCEPFNHCFEDSDCRNSFNQLSVDGCSNDETPFKYCDSNYQCVVNCGEPISCSFPFGECPGGYTCNGEVQVCEKGDKCDSCPGPAPMSPNYLCSDGSMGGPVCSRDSNGDCSWQIRECPNSSCDCSIHVQPMDVLCLDGSTASYTCKQLGDICEYVPPDCPTACDCSTIMLPQLAKQCPDGSYTSATCVPTPDGCSIDYPCTSECKNNGHSCEHPIVGKCLGICETANCVINNYDVCMNRGAMVFSMTLSQAFSQDEIMNELSDLSAIPSSNIVILSFSGVEYLVEFLDSKKVDASSGLTNLQNKIDKGDGTVLKDAKIVVLTEAYQGLVNGDSTEVEGSFSAGSTLTLNVNILVIILLITLFLLNQ